MRLSEIRTDEWVVIDTNILVYANQQKSSECIQLIRRCAVRNVYGIVPMPMVAELIHTLMIIEARENGWIDRANPARVLSEHPELVKRLSHYETQVREFLGIGLRLEPVQTEDILETMKIQKEFGFLTNDSLLLAIARRLNCAAVASADKAFESVKGIMVYTPFDLGE